MYVCLRSEGTMAGELVRNSFFLESPIVIVPAINITVDCHYYLLPTRGRKQPTGQAIDTLVSDGGMQCSRHFSTFVVFWWLSCCCWWCRGWEGGSCTQDADLPWDSTLRLCCTVRFEKRKLGESRFSTNTANKAENHSPQNTEHAAKARDEGAGTGPRTQKER